MSTPLIDVSTFDIASIEEQVKKNHPDFTDFKLVIPEWKENTRKVKKIKMIIKGKEYNLNIGNHKCPKIKDIEFEIERYKHYINASLIDFLWDDSVTLDDTEEESDSDTKQKMKDFLEML